MKRTIRRILHPSDFSPASRAAFARAVDMAKESAAELVLVHVLPLMPPLVSQGYVAPRVFGQIERSVRAAGQQPLHALVARARKTGIRLRACCSGARHTWRLSGPHVRRGPT